MRARGEGAIKQRKDGRWQVSIRYIDDQGVARRPTAYAKTQAEARRRLRDMQRRIEDGRSPLDSSMTLAAWLEIWVNGPLAASARRPSTKATYVSLVRTHLIPSLGAVKLRALTSAHVRQFVIDLEQVRSDSTVRQVVIVLKMALDCAVRDSLLRSNPMDGIELPKRPQVEAAWYPSETVGLLRQLAQGERLEPLLTLIAYTGLRKGEALALRWRDVDLDGAHPRVLVTGTLSRIGGRLVRTEPKTRSGRRQVPLVAEAVLALRRARAQQLRERLAAGEAWTDSEYVFTTEVGTPTDPRNALRWFYGVRDEAARCLMQQDQECEHDQELTRTSRPCASCGRRASDYLGGSLHTLRHSAASVLLGSGVPMPIVKDVLGHSSITVTVDMYGHMAPTLVAQAMNDGMAGYGAL